MFRVNGIRLNWPSAVLTAISLDTPKLFSWIALAAFATGTVGSVNTGERAALEAGTNPPVAAESDEGVKPLKGIGICTAGIAVRAEGIGTN